MTRDQLIAQNRQLRIDNARLRSACVDALATFYSMTTECYANGGDKPARRSLEAALAPNVGYDPVMQPGAFRHTLKANR